MDGLPGAALLECCDRKSDVLEKALDIEMFQSEAEARRGWTVRPRPAASNHASFRCDGPVKPDDTRVARRAAVGQGCHGSEEGCQGREVGNLGNLAKYIYESKP
jgi:hypothetical protein